jgi:hypothetical protein
MKEKSIIERLFTGEWNYAWSSYSSTSDYIISLFYKKGGFSGLYDFILSEKERMGKDYRKYYSESLVELLEFAKKELNNDDFRDYIFKNISFNKNNFKKLEEHGLLKYYYDFSGSFRGDIVNYYKISDYAIIETFSHKEGKSFYNVGDFTNTFATLEEALIYKIYNGKYCDTLFKLLESVESDKKVVS